MSHLYVSSGILGAGDWIFPQYLIIEPVIQNVTMEFEDILPTILSISRSRHSFLSPTERRHSHEYIFWYV